jgi:hypothetical protein
MYENRIMKLLKFVKGYGGQESNTGDEFYQRHV